MAEMPHKMTVQVTFDEEALALLTEIRDLLKASQVYPQLTADETRRLVEQRIDYIQSEHNMTTRSVPMWDAKNRKWAESTVNVSGANEQVKAVNAEPMDNTNLWGTR